MVSPDQIEISDSQRELIEVFSINGALKFDLVNGFELKSGRRSPWLFNSGELIKDARSLSMLAKAFLEALLNNFSTDGKIIDAEGLYGPAYKGIPLASVTAAHYAYSTGNNIGFASHRHEAKDHGEGGTSFGMALTCGDRVIFLDDALTAGTALDTSEELIKRDGGILTGAIILLDRQEVSIEGEYRIGAERITALQEIIRKRKIQIVSILNYSIIRQAIREGLIGNNELGKAMDLHHQHYGAG